MVTAHEQKPTERADLRDALIAAADRLMRERGARGLTTREIAREAGCSDGALYVHFQDKAHLLAAVCERWIPDLAAAVGSLIERVGVATVQENLEAIAAVALRTFREAVSSTFAIGGDPELLTYHQAALKAAGRGPRRGIESIAAYLAAEQRLGRVRSDADAVMAANLVLGSCWQRAAMGYYFGEDLLPIDDAAYAAGLAAAVTRGLEPGGSA
jgi:AcrR family transcriptional regulator